MDVFQPAHDRRLASIARRMKVEGLIHDSFVRPNGLTIIVTKETRGKVRIYDEEDLKLYLDGRALSEFDVSKLSLEEA